MFKRKKLIILGIVLAVVTLVGATAGIAFAQADNAPVAGVQATGAVAGFSNNLTARIAKILGIDQSKLDSAIKQANSDLEAQRLNDYLAKLVQAGKITQDQANQYKAWLNSNPNQTTDQQKKYQSWLDSRPNIPGLTTGPRQGMGGFGFRHGR
jgi:hypothetical protein